LQLLLQLVACGCRLATWDASLSAPVAAAAADPADRPLPQLLLLLLPPLLQLLLVPFVLLRCSAALLQVVLPQLLLVVPRVFSHHLPLCGVVWC
jgi:hypothetical protein